MPTTDTAIRSRLAAVLSLLALGTSLPAAEFQGADAVLRRLLATSDTPTSDSTKDATAQLAADIAAYRRDAATLAPETAATRWLALFDAYARIPEKEMFGQRADGPRVEIEDLITALPPSSAWNTLVAAIDIRTAQSTSLRELSLRLLGTVLSGDRAAQNAAIDHIRTTVRADKKLDGYQLENLTGTLERIAETIAASADDAAQLAAFEHRLSKLETPSSSRARYDSGYLEIPDLVRHGDRSLADPLLIRALRLDVQLHLWGAGLHTRRALAELALKHIDQLKRPHWELISSLEDVALYEAMVQKFPAKDIASQNERSNATLVYLFGLVAAGRTADATALVFDPDTRFASHGMANLAYGSDSLFTQLQRAGRGDAVVEFLRDVLQRDPALPFWNNFIAISARQSRSKAALEFIRSVLARPDLPPGEIARLRALYAGALLAADEIDEGVSVLRALIAADRIASTSRSASDNDAENGAANPAEILAEFKAMMGPETLAALQSGGDFDLPDDPGDNVDGRIQRVMTLLRIGRLLGKTELVEEGLAVGRELLSTARRSESYQRIELVNLMTETLQRIDRAEEAERILTDYLAQLIRESKNGYLSSQVQTVILQLAALYSHAGRHADVLRLLTGFPHLEVADLADLPIYAGVYGDTRKSAHILIADALIATHRPEEARRILRRIVQNAPGTDAAYERLEKLGDTDHVAFLDQAARLDRFEERPLIWKARHQLASGDPTAAEATIRVAIAIDPSDGEQGKGDRLRAYAVLGDILERKGDTEQAAIMRGAVSAIRLSEDADDWWSAGLLSRAVALYERSLLQFADAYCIQSRLALRYSELGDLAKAEEHYRRAFELMPNSFGRIESHCFGCEGVFTATSARNIADQVFTRLAADPAARAQVFYLLGYLRTEQERYEEAAENFRQAVSRDPDYLNAWEKLLALSGAVRLPAAEREAAIFALLRLDPAGKRTSIPHRGSFIELGTLWDALLAAEASLPAKETGPLFEFTASKAKLEEAKKSPDRFGYFARSSSRDEDNGPRKQVLRHEVLAVTIAFLQQTLRR